MRKLQVTLRIGHVSRVCVVEPTFPRTENTLFSYAKISSIFGTQRFIPEIKCDLKDYNTAPTGNLYQRAAI